MRKFILGTDWWTDCDDIVAVRVLTRAMKKGEIELTAIGMDACMEYSVASLDGFLTCEGMNVIPIGIDHEPTEKFRDKNRYQKNLSVYASRYRCNEDAPDAVKLYRKTLAETDGKTEILEIGFLGVLAGLLESKPDEYSPLDGIELVKQKVSKMWVMAGKWDIDGGLEHNFCRDVKSRRAGAVFCEKCPVEVTFLGWEAGYDVITGGLLNEDDILHKAMSDHGSANGRSSWDPMLAVLALTGDESKAGYDTVRGTASVDEETGANHFDENENGLHRYVVRKYEPSYYADIINGLIKTE